MFKLKYGDLIVELERIDDISCYDNNYYRVKNPFTASVEASFSQNLVIYEKYYETVEVYDYSFGYIDEENDFKTLFTLIGERNNGNISVGHKFIFEEDFNV